MGLKGDSSGALRLALRVALAFELLGVCWSACCPAFDSVTCAGHGDCHWADCKCRCKTGFTGGDCSLRTCPMGTSWADFATGVDTAHGQSECSNMGACNRASGDCLCNLGFTGMACERMDCPLFCNGHGKCHSMKYHAEQKDPGRGEVFPYVTQWDAKKVYGCVCDPGYTGHDCLLRDCPRGDDPLTGTRDDTNGQQVNEKQQLNCKATGGKFVLYFRQQPTSYISFDESVASVTKKLNALSTITEVVVTYSAARPTFCSESGGITTIEFLQQHGDVPLLVADTTQLLHSSAIQDPSLTVNEEVKGNKEDAYCSDRGICDLLTGICTCSKNYDTSDGLGGKGTAAHNRGDCGYPSGQIVACPGEVECSGHGVCVKPPAASTYKCLCSSGWQSADCSERSCPRQPSWFDEPLSAERAHQKTECSNAGTCDRSKGECVCALGFVGGACERMLCPGIPPCSAHGQCLSMALMAEKADANGVATSFTYGKIPNDPKTWDFNKIQGCMCDEGWHGYDCALRSCPRGDDPKTTGQHFEQQTITCTADGGYFKLKFRGEETTPIKFDATEAEVTQTLVKLRTVGLRKHESADGLALGKGGWLGADRSVSLFAPPTAFESGVLKVTFTKKWLIFGCKGFMATSSCTPDFNALGDRLPANDLACDAVIPSTAALSGYCVCDAGVGQRRHPVNENYGQGQGVIGFFVKCNHGIGALTCADRCMRWNAEKRALGKAIPDYEPTFSNEKQRMRAVDSFCTADGSNTAVLTFKSELGDLPPVKFNPAATYSNAGNSVTLTHAALTLSTRASTTPDYALENDGASGGTRVTTTPAGTVTTAAASGLSFKGNRENAVCSDRGLCDEEKGECTCFDGYISSDGNGNLGNRRDCGAMIKNPVVEAS